MRAVVEFVDETRGEVVGLWKKGCRAGGACGRGARGVKAVQGGGDVVGEADGGCEAQGAGVVEP